MAAPVFAKLRLKMVFHKNVNLSHLKLHVIPMFGVELLRAGRLYPRQVVDVSDVHTHFAAEWVFEKQCFFRRLKFSPSPPPISHIRVIMFTDIATPMA